jgi:hypothetical protein
VLLIVAGVAILMSVSLVSATLHSILLAALYIDAAGLLHKNGDRPLTRCGS